MPAPLFLLELNPAESIFAPFHDERIATGLPFALEARVPGFRHAHYWDSTKLIWDHAAVGDTVGAITLELAELPARFDQFIFCVVLPAGVSVQFAARRPGGWQPLGEPIAGQGARDHARDWRAARDRVARHVQRHGGRSGHGRAPLVGRGRVGARAQPGRGAAAV
jgi:hypothetical protein